ncbi:MAG: undecaprenyldiphospho-muramoylpentapeptide beta-N-acetylglucosaminyltransferase [Cytophagaceae bacterium]|nr:undecaprenyldiphospho-muramoylpentapeptide beta-N-acetylglucosaminyltransferase [Cytophagaceae bacterium]|tara:strand:+ start:16128 stop:17237 length:1110 start_codon:yes stop_codon:yes gene_type:complete
MSYRFIISGGGTGGHIFPAIAIADELKKRHPDAQFLFVGSQDRMEMQKVPQAGYKIEGLWIAGIQRKLTLSNLAFPLKLMSSLFKSAKIIRRFKPDAVVGTGGFASGPLLEMATRYHVPSLIQEQNSFAGITNKLLAKKVQKICVAYDGMEKFFPADKIVKTGNPVRKDLVQVTVGQQAAIKVLGLSPKKPVLLVLGGSLGARAVNKLIADKLQFILDNDIQVLWQCGKLYHEQYREFEELDDVKVTPFIDNMDAAYAAANYIISRAGAGSVSELCIVGKPVLFIPSPNVAEDHQTKNAHSVASKNAALMIREKDLREEFEDIFLQLVKDEQLQAEMSRNIKQLALPEATTAIVDEIEELLAQAKSKKQ